MPETRIWAEMSWTDFEARDMARTIAVLPVAATEQHGPHLPLGTDTFIMEGYIARVVPRLPDELAVLFLPVQNCGLSIEHTDFPGTLSLPAPTLINAWTKLCECTFRAGCRKLVLLNSHGGNSAILDIVAHDLRARLGMLVVLASWRRFGASPPSRQDFHRSDLANRALRHPSLIRPVANGMKKISYCQHEADLKRLDDAVRDMTEALMRRGACLYQPSFQ